MFGGLEQPLKASVLLTPRIIAGCAHSGAILGASSTSVTASLETQRGQGLWFGCGLGRAVSLWYVDV
jgi:hypothetical protein